MDPWLYYLLALLLIAGAGACWLANLFSLPGNWALLGLAALFAYLAPSEGSRGVSGTTLIILLALAVAGEVVEFAAGALGAAKQGASRRAMIYSLLGAILGSVVGAMAGVPIPVIGSLVAALAGSAVGAFAGAYLGELSGDRSHSHGVAVGKGAMMGRVWGTVGKFAVGAVMLAVLAVDALFI